MRTRRHFQPTLDGMPSRIAPSAVGGLLHSAVLGHISLPSSQKPPVAGPMDTNMPQTNTSSTPIYFTPPAGGSPSTQPC